MEEAKPFRVKIAVKARKFQPVYHYTESLHQAYALKEMINKLYRSPEEKK